jgi:hypothetical protein
MIDNESSVVHKRMANGMLRHQQAARDNKGDVVAHANPAVLHGKRKQLLGIVVLLRYLEIQISELDLEASAALLGAAIADITQNLE